MEAERQMSDEHATRGTLSIEKTMVSNMWKIAVIVEVLEHKGKSYGLNKLIRSPSPKGGNYYERH
jgi:hypothetical protein